ncbi:diaminopimelate decarboxylase [Nanchangia anserum]|uniref:Diaminopimelate decarboxylase n=1 Tax=Nanchangia anserum TaxID=2692125 RepID=A0A8I0GDL8_9ACTO|nr:diaminopimelate decarboxylase [Nanchangia anserum]MBD3690041.1 diaminopimelate decarboxylase [Nanchangia anserum]QOX82163.1 diaminopimelate decarboxylase [Nanchangia anserum]
MSGTHAPIDTAVRADLVCPEPAARPDLWPAGTYRREDGVLVVGGLALTELAESTPTFVWDTADFAARARRWAEAMNEAFDGRAHVHYAAKAFLCARAVHLANDAGLGIDTASAGELECALRAGATPELVGLHGNNKLDAEIDRAITAGIGRIIVDSLDEIDVLEERARACGLSDVPVMVRVTSGVHAGGHEFIATAHEDQKFGLSLSGAAAQAARRVEASDVLRLIGLHSHIGSQIFAIEGFAEAASRLLELVADLAEEGITIDELDLGGGLGIAYTGADPCPPHPREVAAALRASLEESAAMRGIALPRVSIEPGRSIAGPSQIMLYTIGTIKDQPVDEGQVRTYVSIDGGMSDNIRPALYGAAYTATLANRASAAPLRRCRVVGRHCESGDIVIHDVCLPADIRRGDLLAVPAVGAYGHAMASNYNMLTRPGVIAVADGEAETVIARETVDDVLRRDRDLVASADKTAGTPERMSG